MQIVICDDDSRISAVLAGKVGKLYPDSVISTVNSGEELVAFIGNTSPDIVLLDIQMTGMDGGLTGIPVFMSMTELVCGTDLTIFLRGMVFPFCLQRMSPYVRAADLLSVLIVV